MAASSVAESHPPVAESHPPVVMLVLDEFTYTALLDHTMRVDPVLYPHLAALAKDAGGLLELHRAVRRDGACHRLVAERAGYRERESRSIASTRATSSRFPAVLRLAGARGGHQPVPAQGL